MDESHLFGLLRLALTPGVGPTLGARLLEAFATPEAALRASAAQLQRVRGIGEQTALRIVRGFAKSESLAREELQRAREAGVTLVPRGDERYPQLLAQIPDPPLLLYCRGAPLEADAAAVAIVGSRRCTAYGLEQAERFAGVLAAAGLVIVSGGARGIDTAAHRGAARTNGRTLVVLGCGLAHAYPPENARFFDELAEHGNGTIISELPLLTSPAPENFPARNRIVSGLSLGVLVVEAGRRSGALITARQAAEEHGREVMAIPGRVDSPTSDGVHDLLRLGGAHLVSAPAHVLEVLETPARHAHLGTHAARYCPGEEALFDGRDAPANAPATPALDGAPARVLAALDTPRSMDDLVDRTGLSAAEVRQAVTMLEIQGRVRRAGSRLERRSQR